MKRSQLKEMSMEIMVGAFMFMVLLALAFFTIILSYENIFQPSYHLQARFEHVQGLRQGDNVFMRGVLIGRVKSLSVEPDGVLVLATLEQKPDIREGYRIEIKPSSVLGGTYLSIYEGPPGTDTMPDDIILQGSAPVDLMDEATGTIKAIRDAMEEGQILYNIEKTMANLTRMTDDLAEGRGTIGRLLVDETVYDNLEAISVSLRDVTGMLERGEGTLGALIHDDTLYANLAEVSTRLAEGKGMMGRLLSEDDALYDDIAAAAAALREVTEKINAGEGTIGKLVGDDELYEEAKLLLHEIRAAIDDFRETAPITTFTSIFFGAF